MAQKTPQQQPGRLRPGVYWRRRAVVLALGISVASLPAWGVTGLLGGLSHVTRAAAAATGSTGRPRHPATVPSRAAASSTPSVSAVRASASTAAATSALAAGSPPSGHLPAGVAPACTRRNVVLSLATSQGSYGSVVRPEFDVYVVNVGSQKCSVNVGPAYLYVVVKAGGTRRMWASSDCARASGPDFVQLGRGIPSVLHFSWDRKGSAPGCRLAGTAAQPGTYTAIAVATGPHLASQNTIFVLTGSGVGMP